MYALVLAVAALDVLLPLVPSEATLISAGALAATGELDLGLVLGAGALGAVAGDNAAYSCGRLLRHRIPRRLQGGRDRTERALASRATVVLFVARFIPAGRSVTTVTAGAVAMPWSRFAVRSAAACLVWACYTALAGYAGGHAFESRPWLGVTLALGVVAVGGLAVRVVAGVRTGRLVIDR
jgi:membrane protein DedA with SNARE-associated domain